jgi:hypothetical protein
MKYVVNAKHFKQTQKEHKSNAPELLPRKRPRALTCPLPAEPDKSSRSRSWNPFRKSIRQQTCDQSQSALLARLPSEIRLLIWTEVLGGHLLHIVRAPKRLLAIDCADEVNVELETRHHLCWGIETERAPGFYLSPHTHHPAKPANLLPLLQTCRRIYTEVISILYEDNIFDINRLSTLLYLQRSVLLKRLNQIRVLNLTWDYALIISASPIWYDLDSWHEACEVLMSFAGLQELTVHFTNWRKNSWPGADWKVLWGPLLEALMRIKTAKKFDVFLPWSEDECAEAAKDGGYLFRLMPMADVMM